jgi:hypothetical protein
VKPEARGPRRHAAALVLLAAALWWHAWMPAVIVVAFVGWAVLHARYQGARRDAFMRARARVWPPDVLVLVALIVAGITLYTVSTAAIEARVMPIALNAVALSILVVARIQAVSVRAPFEPKPVDDLATKGRRA